MPKQSKEKADATRLAILDAAELVFDAKGVSGATLEGIAATAGLTRGAFYWHFGDKQTLLKALLMRRIEPLTAAFRAGLRASAEASLAGLLMQTEAVLRQLLADPDSLRVCRILLLKCEYVSAENDNPIQAAQADLFKALTITLETYFKRVKETQAGAWPKITPAVAAKAYQCFILGLMMQYLKLPHLIDLERQLPVYLRSFFLFSISDSMRRGE